MRHTLKKINTFITERKLVYRLKRVGTWNLQHARASFFEHLWGTYKLLRKWDCVDEVCYAGLFHSIYGTQYFRHITIPKIYRSNVRAWIGIEAEKLVYLFAIANRPKLFLDDDPMFKLNDDIKKNLLHMELANLIDQRGDATYLKALHEKYRSQLSNPVRADVEALLSCS